MNYLTLTGISEGDFGGANDFRTIQMKRKWICALTEHLNQVRNKPLRLCIVPTCFCIYNNSDK